MAKKASTPKSVTALTHDEAKRKNIPSAEQQSIVQREHEQPRQVKYPRNTDLDPQLVWRGKDEQDWSDLVAHAPPLYIQEKVHPKALIDDLVASDRWLVASGKDTGHHGSVASDQWPVASGKNTGHHGSVASDQWPVASGKNTGHQPPATGHGLQLDLFADFNGLPKGADKTEFYQHDQNWSNRMILGDSLQVMASLAEREGLR
ncbi:MAG: hypothetical protein ACREIA_17275, partial [Opitutaceae bacterium]